MAASNKRQDNTIEIVQKAIKVYDIPVTKNSVAEYLKAHPEYPSLTSVKDAFSEWEVENYAVKLKPLSNYAAVNHFMGRTELLLL